MTAFEIEAAAPEPAPLSWKASWSDFVKRATLGAAAGGIGGLLVGGVGGRVAMLFLRFTSPDSLTGVETDDGFEIGQFTISGTLNLLIGMAVLGSIVGIFVVLSKAFLPFRWVTPAWALAGATVGGTTVIHDDGLDFEVVTPVRLAVALFIALPGMGALLIAFLVDRFEPWWWQRPRPTILAGMAAAPLLIAFPVVLLVAAAATVWAFAERDVRVRSLPLRQSIRALAGAVFALVVVSSGALLAGDVRAVL